MRRSTSALLLTLAVALAVLPMPGAAAQSTPTATLAPRTSGVEAVKQGQFVVAGGSGFPDAPITSARLIARDPAGGQQAQVIPASDLNIPPRDGNHLRIQGGALEGQLLLGCLFGPPSTCETPHGGTNAVLLEVTVDGVTTTSNAVRVDYTPPRVLRYDLTSEDTVVVVFSEPVRIPAESPFNTDRPGDWALTDPNATVLSVTDGPTACTPPDPDPGKRCSRLLTFTPPVSPDATPRVDYDANRTTFGDPYEDYAGNRLEGFTTLQRAVDRIRPPIPEITRIAAEAPDRNRRFSCTDPVGAGQDSNVTAPELALSGLTAGHRLEIVARRGGTSPVTYAFTASGATQTVRLDGPSLVPDAEDITLTAVAIDPNGNRSTQPGSPPRGTSDGESNPLCYHLDTIAPRVLAAIQQGPGRMQVRVTFDEAVQPTAAGTWQLDGRTATQVQAGSSPGERILTFPEPGTVLSWTRGSGTGYTDLVGNPLPDIAAFPVQSVPLPIAPVIQVPGAGVVTNATSTPIGGTQQVRAGETLSVQAYSDAEGTTAVGQLMPVSGGTWSGTVPLPGGMPANQQVTFTARAIDGATGVRSPVATSQTITVDRQDPTNVAITQPTSASPLGGAAEAVGPGVLQVRWTASDPNPDRFELSMADAAGGAITCTAPRWTGSGPYEGACEITDQAAAGQARITLRAVDLATNDTVVQSVPIPIDPEILGATATLRPPNQQPSRVEIRYTQPVSGGTLPTHWRADDGQGGAVDRTPIAAEQSGDLVALTFPQAFAGGHPNARPVYEYPGPLVGDGLRGPDGQPIPRRGLVFDVIAAGLAVDAVPATTNGLANRQQIATCTTAGAAGPACPPSGPVLRVTGRTDDWLDVNRDGVVDPAELNTVTIVRGDLAQPGPHPRLATAVVRQDGTWEAVLPLDPGQPLTATVVAEDINPFPSKGPTTQVITVLDDSVGPTITAMSATLVTSEADDVIVVPMTFSEIAQRVALTYQLGGAAAQELGVLEPGADQATFRWTDLPFDREALAAGLQITATATDLVGNVGPPRTVGLSNLPRLQSATLLDELTVQVTTTEPVTTERTDAAGFSVGGGPGVRRAGPSGVGDDVITLALADPIGPGEFRIRYNGQGGWASTGDGRPLQAGEVPLVIGDGVLLPITGLAAGPSCTGDGVVLSFIDERNTTGVAGYEVTRDGTLIATLEPDERIVTDEDAGDGVHVYEVTAIGDDGVRSDPVRIRIEVGGSPVPGSAADAALAAGSGAPDGSTARDDVVFGGQPNIGATGGTVLSCDGRVAALVPEGVLDGPAYGAFVRRSGVPTPGLTPQGDLYQLVAVEADPGFPVLDVAAGFVELSFRDQAEVLADGTPERVTAIRVAGGPDDRVVDELAARVGRESVAAQLVTLGTFALAEADGASVRVFGPDPAYAPDRFATAAALSQTRFAAADTVVLARADDYPDALAAAPLAAQLGGPVLLSRTTDVPELTLYELARLGTSTVHLVGGEVALSEAVAAQLEAAGLSVVRTAGPSRFETAAEVARQVGSVDGRAFLATGLNFADALAASAPAATLGRPILLTATDEVPPATRAVLDQLLVVGVDLVGGEVAIGAGVAEGLAADGFAVRRSAGPTRYATAVALAERLVDAGQMDLRQLVIASGDGDGRTSPDALAAGPVAGRIGGPLLLTPQAQLTEEVADFLAAASALRGLYLAGGEVAVSAGTRAAIDEAAAR